MSETMQEAPFTMNAGRGGVSAESVVASAKLDRERRLAQNTVTITAEMLDMVAGVITNKLSHELSRDLSFWSFAGLLRWYLLDQYKVDTYKGPLLEPPRYTSGPGVTTDIMN